MSDELSDKFRIRETVENWVIWRDSGNWDRFRTVWHEGARMQATWFRGSVDDFIANARRSFERGALDAHSLGGSSIEIVGTRAIAQTKSALICVRPSKASSAMSFASNACYQFFSSGPAPERSCCIKAFMKKTGSIRLTRRPGSSSIKRCWRNFPKATGTSPMSRPRRAFR